MACLKDWTKAVALAEQLADLATASSAGAASAVDEKCRQIELVQADKLTPATWQKLLITEVRTLMPAPCRLACAEH